jgi:hypothetical protein
MPISGDVWMDPNASRYGLPKDSCVGDDGPSPTQVTNISKGGPKARGAARLAPAGGDPYAGGKSVSPGWRNPRTVVSGPDLPNDYDTDDPVRR